MRLIYKLQSDMSIYESLKSTLMNGEEMPKELQVKAWGAQWHLDRWSSNRQEIMNRMEEIAKDLDGLEKASAIATTVGSSVDIASGLAVFGGLFFMPPVAIAGLIVGAASGVSNVATGVNKKLATDHKIREINRMLAEDAKFFEELLHSRNDLLNEVRRFVEDKQSSKIFKNFDDVQSHLKTLFGVSLAGITGFGIKMAASSMGHLTNALMKGMLQSVAAIGIVLDGVTLAMSANTLKNGSSSELAGKIREASGKMERMRHNVVTNFLNYDAWNSD